jgi:immune inhibitor A
MGMVPRWKKAAILAAAGALLLTLYPGTGRCSSPAAPAGLPAVTGPAAPGTGAVSVRPLVILVEFAGTDNFTWTPGTSTWDPLGDPDPAENAGDVGNCTLITTKMGITDATPRNFSYTGPLHNTIERPRGAADVSRATIWTTDFSSQWYKNLLFGNGVTVNYDRTDTTNVSLDFTGRTLKDYFHVMSEGTLDVSGDVIGWIQVPHSIWWYGADQCPGRASGLAVADGGAIPGAGTRNDLVKDALNALQSISNTIPGFDWANYDQDGDGVIDQLWIIHAGLGEEAPSALLRTYNTPAGLKRTAYGEASPVSGNYAIAPAWTIPSTTMQAGPYILLPEDAGIGTVAHEYGHALGGVDLAGSLGTSVGVWSPLSDSGSGYPTGFLPASLDPLLLERKGWRQSVNLADPGASYDITLAQAGSEPADPTHPTGVRVDLPDSLLPNAVPPIGAKYWYGGKLDLSNGMMTLKDPLAIPSGAPASLSFDLVWGIETQWDFLWVQLSTDGTAWTTLTNGDTTCNHDPGWIGEINGFPADLCAAGIGGFTDYNPEFPAYRTETFDLSAWAGQSVYLRFWYMTDWGTTYEGVFLDNVVVSSNGSPVFSDDAESGGDNWTYVSPMEWSDGHTRSHHGYYLQWRNTTAAGGYDAGIGDARGPLGPAQGGLLVWYRNDLYSDNDCFNVSTGVNRLNDYPGFGPKGKLLIVDAHPDPYRDPYWVGQGYANEGANLDGLIQSLDAPFSLSATAGFTLSNVEGYVYTDATAFASRPAVSTFDDALGYYPGAEFVAGGPVGQTTPRWMTLDWDASAVVPSSAFYGIKAPGYTNGTRFRFDCSLNTIGQILCYAYGTGPGYDGGDGNPGTAGGNYGWKFEVVEEAADRSWGRIALTGPPVALNGHVYVAQDGYAPVTLQARDTGSLVTSWTVVSQPAHGTLTGTPPALVFTPATGFLGSDTFEFRAGTAAGHTNTAVITLEVIENIVPAINPIADMTVAEGNTLSFTVTTNDISDTLTFASANLPPGASLDASTGVFTWRPRYDQAEGYPGVTITVTDSHGAGGSATFTITVTDPSAPIFADTFDSSASLASWDLTGSWRVSPKGRLVSPLATPGTALLKLFDASAFPFLSGVIETRAKMTSRFAAAPNAAVVFASPSPTAYRYVRLKAGAVIIGQKGTIGGSAAVTKRKSARVLPGRFYDLKVKVFGPESGPLKDGLVEAWLGGTRVHSWKFAASAPGRVGLLTKKAVAQFDSFTVKDDGALSE